MARELLNNAARVYADAQLPGSARLKDVVLRGAGDLEQYERMVGRPNPGQIKRAIEQTWKDRAELVAAVVETWASQHARLVARCAGWLSANSEALLSRLNGISAHAENAAAISTTLFEFSHILKQEQACSDSEDATRLAMMIAFKELQDSGKFIEGGVMKEPDHTAEVKPEHSLETDEGWSELLSSLEQIPAEAPQWQSFERFLNKAQAVAAEKRAQLVRLQESATLREALESHYPALLERAEYLQVESVRGWQVEQVLPKHYEAAAAAIYDLKELLVALAGLENMPVTNIRAQRLKWENDRRQLEEKIITGFDTAKWFFHASLEEEQDRKPDNETAIEAPGEAAAVTDTLTVKTQPAELPVHMTEFSAQQSNSVADEAVPAGEMLPAETSLDQSTLIQDEEVAAISEMPSAEDLGTDELGDPETKIPIMESAADVGFEKEPVTEQKEEISPVNHNIEEEVERLDEDHETSEGSQEDTKNGEDEEIEGSEVDESGSVISWQLESPSQIPTVPASEEESNAELINKLNGKDLPVSFWLAYGLEKQNRRPAIPSWLIAAQQAALSSIQTWPDQSREYLDGLSEEVKPERRSFEGYNSGAVWMGLSASIFFSLLDTNGRWESWLNNPLPAQGFRAINELIEVIVDSGRKGVHLDPMMVQMVVNEESVENYIVEQSKKARQWVHQSSTRSARFSRAQQVWIEFVRPGKGDLYKLINKVALDQRDAVDDICAQMDNWHNHIWLEKHIQKVDRDLVGKPARPIVGEARDQLIAWVDDINVVVDEWCHAVKSQREANQKSNWTFSQVSSLCGKLGELIGEACQTLQSVRATESDEAAIQGINLFEQTLRSLAGIVAPQEYHSGKSRGQVVDQTDLQKPVLNQLAHALFFYPELDLDNSGIPMAEKIDDTVTVLTKLQPHSSEDAIQAWLRLGDYRFLDDLLIGLPTREIWETRISESLHAHVDRLEKKDIDETMVAIEQALLESLIAEQEYTGYRSRVESIRKQIRQIDTNGNQKISMRDYVDRLQEIRATLTQKRLERVASLQHHWDEINKKLPDLMAGEQTYYEKIVSVVVGSIQTRDLRAAGEYLALLDDALSSGRIPEISLFESRSLNRNQDIIDFQKLLPGYVSLLEPRSAVRFERIRDVYVKDDPLRQIPLDSLARERRDEVAQAFDAWQALKKFGKNRTQENLPHIKTLISFLGFTLIGVNPVSTNPISGGMPNFQRWRVSADPGGFAPVAQFGSLRKKSYDVLGIWDRPGIEVISSQVTSLMQQTENSPSILLFFHYLTPARRDLLLATTHKGGLPILVIDEPVLFHLAREHDTRLRPMFNTTLPYSAVKPYFPAAAGLVPPEVFKGRHKLVRDLIDPFGPAIVYGGRQLGKSALLRQVERETDHPDNGQLVIYEDIRLIGDRASGKPYQTEFRDRLAQALVNKKFPELQRASMDLDKLLNHITQQVREKKIRLLLLLDEADHFLDADAERNFIIITKLKNAMDQTGRQFKIVLAGLHNVQRFQRIANQPLAHLGQPIEIGPLEPEAARQLLVDPLHAIGFRFGTNPENEDTSLVLHILSYTNYHPGLIQLFGSYLVEHLLSKSNKRSKLPMPITRDDVEKVYRRKEVRDAIRERFALTLALDPRYEAITLALILEQLDDQNGFDKTYAPGKLRDLAATWWPQAFSEEVSPDRFKGYLEEMRGLGVLSAKDGSSYRLRSPNLVHLMGTRDEIMERMDYLSKSIPPEEGALESIHALLDTNVYSPLTFGQERTLNNPKSGVVMIFGSKALGFGGLGDSLKRLLPEKNGAWNEIRVAARSAEAIQQQLKQFIKENPSAGLLIAYRELEGDAEKMADEILGAVHLCNQIRNNKLRVCFALDSQATWQWFQLPRGQREAVEERVEVVMSLQHWDSVGIKQRLIMEPGAEEVIPDRLINKLIDATGGWPCLLDEYKAPRIGSTTTQTIEMFHQELRESPSIIRSFLSALEIYDALPRRVVEALKDKALSQAIRDDAVTYADALGWLHMWPELECYSIESLDSAVQYLKIMGVITGEQHPELEPMVARYWHES